MENFVENIADKLLTYEGFYFPVKNFSGQLNKANIIQHVYKWLNQFNLEDQERLARITSNILEKTYIQKDEEQKFIKALFENPHVKKGNLVAYPLTIQRNGLSQKQMIELYKKIVEDNGYEYDLNNFIYLDDFMFSGGRVFTDISNFIPLVQKNITLLVVVVGWHRSGQWTQSQKINEKIKNHQKLNGVAINIEWLSLPQARMENRLTYMNQSDVLWPMEKTLDLPELSNRKIQGFKYRTGFIQGQVFDNHEDRIFLEKICLKYGFQIIDKCISLNRTTRPLGNSSFDFGFGGLVFNYRNCPNNTPLIFWWGSNDPCSPMSHQWYPLMPRRTYNHG